MKLATITKLLTESSSTAINLRSRSGIQQLAQMVADKEFPTSFTATHKTSEGDLELKFDLYSKSIPEDENLTQHIIEFTYRLDKSSYTKIKQIEKNLQSLSDEEDPDGERYDTFSSEASVDGFKFYAEYKGKPSDVWGDLD